MSYPNYTSCLSLLKNEGVSDGILKHVKTVQKFSQIIGKRLIEQGHQINVDLLEAGALLHDIGRSRTHGITHAIEGVKISNKLGLSRDIRNIIRNHIGAGITREEAIERGLPAEDFIPDTLEEKVVAAADNLTYGDSRQSIRDHMENMRSQGIIEGAERSLSLHKELSGLCGMDLDELLKSE